MYLVIKLPRVAGQTTEATWMRPASLVATPASFSKTREDATMRTKAIQNIFSSCQSPPSSVANTPHAGQKNKSNHQS